MITCGDHGRADGYIVCVHIIDGARVVHLVTATQRDGPPEHNLGEALCEACCTETLDDIGVERLRIICAGCLSALIGTSVLIGPKH